MSNVKDSIRLPKTQFPIRAKFATLQEQVLTGWERNDTYNQVLEKNKAGQVFILHDGPPYANGHIHLGHAVNRILKDTIVRAHMVLGHYTPFVLGWDCHGLPIEWKVEENYKVSGLRRSEIDICEFREECKKFADYWIDIQKNELTQLGIMSDPSKVYLTTDHQAEGKIVEALFTFLEEGYLYQGKKPVLWSCVEQTVLAEAEVEYKEKTSNTVFVGYSVVEANKECWLNALAVIWTTTPWTLPANQGIAYSPDVIYGLYDIEVVAEDSLVNIGSKLIVAQELSYSVFETLGILKYSILDDHLGLPGIKVQHPFYGLGFDSVYKALPASFVDMKTGTGIVHIAPAHGEDDFYLAMENNIVPIEIVNGDGCYIDSLPLFASSHIFKADREVVEVLTHNGRLLHTDTLVHSYPHSWRSKSPLVYRLTTQWFIDLKSKKITQRAIDLLDQVNFVPTISKNRLSSMLASRPDWCISRQRSWGVPLPIFVNKNTKEPLIDKRLFSSIIKGFYEHGSNFWFENDPKDLLLDHYNKDDFVVINDIVDVWLESGLTHRFVLDSHYNLQFPSSLYLEGSDQHRGWFQSSVLTSVLLNDKLPFSNLLTHGFVLDQQGGKMSKSQGNITKPLDIINKYGADVLRIWVINSNYTEDLMIGDQILQNQAEVYKKLRNTIRYLLSIHQYQANYLVYNQLLSIDKWLLHRVAQLDIEFESVFNGHTFDLHGMFVKLVNFAQAELSAFYFDIKKDCLYCDSSISIDFRSTVTTMHLVLGFLLKWLSPFIPFTTEEAYAEIQGEEYIGKFLLSVQPTISQQWLSSEVSNKWSLIQRVRKVVLSCLEQQRENKKIRSSLEAHIFLYVDKDYFDLLCEEDLADIFIVSCAQLFSVNDHSSLEDLFSLSDVPNVWVDAKPFDGLKCVRCWKYYSKLSESFLCNRCQMVLENG